MAIVRVPPIPGLVGIRATRIAPPPGWALQERHLMGLMEQGANLMMEKYAERGGVCFFADDVDDLYEMCYNWGLFYALGAGERVLELALQQWNATTRFFDDRYVSRVHPRFRPQLHNDYYNLATPAATSGTTRGRATWPSTVSGWPIPPSRRMCGGPGNSRPCTSVRTPGPPTTTRATGSSALPCRPARGPTCAPRT
jgi:hypothetical protein